MKQSPSKSPKMDHQSALNKANGGVEIDGVRSNEPGIEMLCCNLKESIFQYLDSRHFLQSCQVSRSWRQAAQKVVTFGTKALWEFHLESAIPRMDLEQVLHNYHLDSFPESEGRTLCRFWLKMDRARRCTKQMKYYKWNKWTFDTPRTAGETQRECIRGKYFVQSRGACIRVSKLESGEKVCEYETKHASWIKRFTILQPSGPLNSPESFRVAILGIDNARPVEISSFDGSNKTMSCAAQIIDENEDRRSEWIESKNEFLSVLTFATKPECRNREYYIYLYAFRNPNDSGLKFSLERTFKIPTGEGALQYNVSGYEKMLQIQTMATMLTYTARHTHGFDFANSTEIYSWGQEVCESIAFFFKDFVIIKSKTNQSGTTRYRYNAFQYTQATLNYLTLFEDYGRKDLQFQSFGNILVVYCEGTRNLDLYTVNSFEDLKELRNSSSFSCFILIHKLSHLLNVKYDGKRILLYSYDNLKMYTYFLDV